MFKEGSFWHAYNWSAWLVCAVTYNNKKHKEAKDSEPIAVIHKLIGGKKNPKGSYTMIGFQMRSIDKYIPKRTKVETIDDKQMLIEIELPQPTDGTALTYERLQNAYEAWKAEQPLSKKDDDEDDGEKPQKPASKPHPQAPTVLTSVEAQLLAWPLEQHSPIETINFVAEMKSKLAAIFIQESDH